MTSAMPLANTPERANATGAIYRLAAAAFGHPLPELQQALSDGSFHTAFNTAWHQITGRKWPRCQASADFAALEHSISCCDPTRSNEDLLSQRREDVNFHDILAAANPNPFLRFTCELINEMIRQLIVFGNRTPKAEHRRFGEANAQIHRDIVQAARARDAEKVRELMTIHMRDAANSVKRMKGRIQGRLILDADSLRRPRSAHVRSPE